MDPEGKAGPGREISILCQAFLHNTSWGLGFSVYVKENVLRHITTVKGFSFAQREIGTAILSL
jgi:hypothetical protein